MLQSQQEMSSAKNSLH